LWELILIKTTDTERRLAAIFAADVEGFSRLMGSDEVGTFRDLTERRGVLDALIASHRGRIANTAGDSVLAEFVSAVDAVQCAVAAQGALAEANAGASPDRHINFRIGVHVGDVMVRGGDLFGDGVNITARLQTLAAPGGVSVSGAAYDHVRKLLPFKFADLGAQQVKNIEEPVRVYAVSAATAQITSASTKAFDERGPIPLPDKPSIAVLPFQNMSGDPEQDYFADGMVEDITTALSRFTTLFVIARNSTFTYKGRAVDIKQVGRELGVRYVLEGSVRKAAGRLRITGQLIDACSGAHLWAEKFDGSLEDVFELQDSVTERVVGAIETSVNQAEINRSRAKPTSNLDAYDYYLRALQQFTLYTGAGSDAAIENAQKAISLDPDYALAKALLSSTYMTRRIRGWGTTEDAAKALAVAREAIAEDSNNPSVLRWAGLTLGFWGDHDRSIALLEKAARLNVNGSQIWLSLGWAKVYACTDTERAIAHFERAMRLSPRDPEMASMLTGISFAHLISGHYEKALSFAQQSIDEGPQFTSGHRAKTTALIFLNRQQEAGAAAEMLLTCDPRFTISSRLPPYRDPDFQQRYHAALKAAGLSD
jgi:TolB-like protein/class 3 adenylate cyclase/tetratricopeptide (TPR) repeat protein